VFPLRAACAEETFRAVEQALVVLTPFHALSGAKVLEGAITDVKQVTDDRIGTRHIDRPVRVREAKRLLSYTC
jgi:hypothetical protein